ncbi:polysaccharide deacetylase family protein [Parashewanella tropica]|uniref:polysaccharide deacetylase family protein n=1 Tax=Parashewanella tropica TaxID=2547970 RepID=UPI00105992F6|nr:polysaccharide deacetylase family protein [Parashewanella tropica]
MKLVCKLILILGFFVISSVQATVILQYHHVSSDTPAITSVTPEQFAEQMQYLVDHEFNVVPLSKVITALKKKQTLPNKTVAITFDDGYRTIYENARPILNEYDFPYTMFLASKPIEQGFKNMMSWKQIQTIAKEGAEIMNHTYDHVHLIRMRPNESQTQWLTRIKSNIEKNETIIKQYTGQNFKALAYPYGEYNTHIMRMLTEMGYVAFGQHSGAAGVYSSLTALPRFPVAVPFSKMSALKVKIHSLAMPVLKQQPIESQIDKDQHRPTLTLTIDTHDIRKSQLMCYVSHQGAHLPVWINDNTFTIQAKRALAAGRSRYNCTVPSKTSNRYYWFSHTWVKPKPNGEWVKE